MKYTYFHFTSEIKDILYLRKIFEFSFYYIQPIYVREENFIIHKLTLISSSVLWQQTSVHARVIPNTRGPLVL